MYNVKTSSRNFPIATMDAKEIGFTVRRAARVLRLLTLRQKTAIFKKGFC
jgi:hypothetical protein